MNIDQKYSLIYKSSEKFLHDNLPEGIDLEELNMYLINNKKFETLNDVFKRMAISLQNYQAMPRIINFEKNIEKMREILFNFDPHKVFSYYDSSSLFDKFCSIFKVSNPENPRNSWLKFSKGIISGSKFLSNFKDGFEFDNFVKKFDDNQEELIKLPIYLKNNIFGLGFALSCDFLKELGYTNYPKPDVHLMDVFHNIGISKYDQYENYRKIIDMANTVGKTPYEVDKLFWLICSGKYYMHDINGKPLKKELIKHLLSSI